MAGQAAFGRTGSGLTVRVQRGDSLWSLSSRYGVSMQQLAAANGMRLSDVLLAGRTLRLPGAAAGKSGAAGKDGATAGAKAGPTFRSPPPTVKVAPGSFCTTYVPPTGPKGKLPSGLSPKQLALRPLFVKWADRYRVPLDLILAESWQESGWQNNVVSPDGARGIGQLLPSTADFVNRQLGTKLDLAVPSDNIQMMAAFLAYLLQATGGQICPTVAAYYQGLGALQRYGVFPVSEGYVRAVLSLRPRFR